MAQFFGTEDIKDLTKATQTTISWASGSNLRIGGQAYNIGSELILDLSSDIDTGSVTSDTIYYIYAVVVANTVSLKYSLSATAPTGFVAFRKIGAFQTDGSAEVISTSKKDVGSVGDVMHSRLTEEQFIKENGAGWVLYDDRDISGSKLAALASITNLEDARGQFLRATDNGAGVDSGRVVGTVQGEGTAVNGLSVNNDSSLDGTFQVHGDGGGQNTTGNFSATKDVTLDTWGDGAGDTDRINFDGNHGHGLSSGDLETRPRNLAVNVFIKIDDIEL